MLPSGGTSHLNFGFKGTFRAVFLVSGLKYHQSLRNTGKINRERYYDIKGNPNFSVPHHARCTIHAHHSREAYTHHCSHACLPFHFKNEQAVSSTTVNSPSIPPTRLVMELR